MKQRTEEKPLSLKKELANSNIPRNRSLKFDQNRK